MDKNSVIMVFGEPIEIVVPSKSTGYTCCAGVQTSPPGGGPPPHKHEREEETFVVLEGEYDFFDGQEWVPLMQGEVMFSRRGHYHAFRNTGASPGRMFFTTNAGGLDDYFALISALVMPEDQARLVEISEHFGYVFQGL